DLFSTGVLLWEMLTGRRLFARPDADATLDAVLRAPIPRPSSVRPEVPPKLDEVVMRALERDRNARWPEASDMLAALNKQLYSLDEIPGPRDVAALVARFCPPETRRLPTHLEAIAHDVISPEPLEGGRPPTEVPASSGPSTAVIPRDQQARGKPQRQKSFATNVNLQAMLDKADPLPSFDEPSDVHSDVLPAFHEGADKPTKEDRPKTPRVETPLDKPSAFAADTVIDDRPPLVDADARPSIPTTKRRSRPMDTVDDSAEEPIEKPLRRTPRAISAQDRHAARSERDIDQARKEAKRAKSLAEPDDDNAEPAFSKERTAVDDHPPSFEVPKALREPPSRAFLVIAGLGGIALAAGAVYIFFQGRERVLAMGERDAAVVPSDAAPDGYLDAPSDAAFEIDAGPEPDAGTRHSDAPIRPTIDASMPTIDAPAVAKGTGTLQVGADPWGEIYVDGKSMGRTPKELTVGAGHHTVEVVFAGETPPRKQTFAVDIANGETKPIQADFK
ncbi:MAG TPA: PEGA domain-containing protein, partial [Kofleriaceae bacterium]|nr:PEGA domain-containing protein [Kofleriaceae bacterium]